MNSQVVCVGWGRAEGVQVDGHMADCDFLHCIVLSLCLSLSSIFCTDVFLLLVLVYVIFCR